MTYSIFFTTTNFESYYITHFYSLSPSIKRNKIAVPNKFRLAVKILNKQNFFMGSFPIFFMLVWYMIIQTSTQIFGQLKEDSRQVSWKFMQILQIFKFEKRKQIPWTKMTLSEYGDSINVCKQEVDIWQT